MYVKISCFVLCLLALGMPAAFASDDESQCMQDKECLAMVEKLEKEFRDNSIEIKRLEALYTKLQLVFDKKKNLYSIAKKNMIETELTALENAILESKDWHQAFLADMNNAVAVYDKDELEDLLYAIGDLKEPIGKAYTQMIKVRKLLL